MASYNRVVLLGNLTRDVEIKYTPKGTAVAEFGLAINRYYTTDSGEKREETTFVECSCFGRIAEILGEYCKKGKPLHVEGRLQLDTWDDKQTGQKRSKLKVIAESIQLLNSAPPQTGEDRTDYGQRRPSSGRAGAPPERAAGRPANPPPRPPADPDLDSPEDDIPF